MNNPRRPSLSLAILLATLCLAACSALQIDVDVYKGPLSNEEEMQARQFAALAVSAKPMLAALRNEIEDTHVGSGRWRARVVDRDALDGFLGDSDTRLLSPLARFVNGALYLYEDADESPDAAVRRAHGNLVAALALSTPEDIDFKIAASIPTGKTPALKVFAEAYRDFLCPAHLAASCRSEKPLARPVRKLAEACTALAESLTPGPGAPDCPLPERLGKSDKRPPAARTNRSFEVLSDPQVVAGHAQLLFGRQDPEFEERVVSVARGFGDARQAMQSLLRSALDLLLVSAKPADRVAAGKVVAGSLQPEYLACFLLSDRQHDMGKHAALQGEMARWFKSQYAKGSRRDRFNFPEANAQVALWAARSPGETAGLLAWINQRFSTLLDGEFGACPDIPGGDPGRLEPASVRRFGLARGPTDDLPLSGAVSALQDDVDALPKEGNASGFDRGRLPEGIDSLTRRFLEALGRHDHRMNHPEIRRALANLEESLVFFAERVLFVVNNTTYRALQDEFPGRSKQTQTTQAVGDALYVTTSSGAGIERLATRMAVLQTLGNTLILHANDLRRRRVHQQAQRDAGPAELRAAKAALAPGADAAFDGFLRHARQHAELRKALADSSVVAATVSTQALAERLPKADAELAARNAELFDINARITEYGAQAAVLEAAVRTLVPPSERGTLFPTPADGVLANQERGDANAATKAATPVTTEANLGPADLLPDLLAWVKERAKPPSTGAQAKRLEMTRSLLAAPGSLLDLGAAKTFTRADAFAALQRSLLAAAGTYQLEVLKLGKRKLDLNAASADINKQLDAARANATKAAADQLSAKSAADAAQGALGTLEGLREAVVTDAVKAQVRDAAGVQRLLLAALDKATKTPATPAALPGLNAATDLVGKLTPPPASAALAALGSSERGIEPREVIDQVIAELRQLRVQALAAGDEGRARNLLSAINAAYETRSNATFLRPASEYLKSVYSSTTVQDGSSAADDNLLDNYLRFVKRDVDADEFARRTRQAKEQVEKLYWQNINRVTLAGGGKTNYVLAKDDVGNWYVKAYTADPETVIKSAQSLALFGAGKRIDTNLLRKLDLQRRADDPTRSTEDRATAQAAADNTGADANIGLDRVRARFGAGYASSIVTLADRLQSSIAGLPAALRSSAASGADFKDMNSAQFAAALGGDTGGLLAGAEQQLKLARDLPPLDVTRTQRLEDAVIGGLTALRRFYLAASATLAADKTLGLPDNGAKAVALVKTESKQHIDSHGKRLRAALDTFESGLHVVGDAKTAP